MELPSLSGNPFEIRPLSIGQAQDLIGRDEIVIEWRTSHPASPGGDCFRSERGSENFTAECDRFTIFRSIHSDGWPLDDDPVKSMVTVAAHFLGHNLPSVISETISRLSQELDTRWSNTARSIRSPIQCRGKHGNSEIGTGHAKNTSIGTVTMSPINCRRWKKILWKFLTHLHPPKFNPR